MMNQRSHTTRRGLSMLELMIALSITALVGAALAGMLNAVSVGVDSRHDHRTATIRAHHAQTRLASYITPSRCILHRDANALVLWFDDSRNSDTVHISEVRWLIFDSSNSELTVQYVTMPSGLTDWQYTAYDKQHSASSDWMDLLGYYQLNSQYQVDSMKLIDGLTAATPFLDDDQNVLDARHVTYHLTFNTQQDEYDTIASAAIRRHQPPAQ